ncbi:hypothetical protein [Burkholderia glumae]|uniref:hypothetical protein n=1 Tax=Burkholderia glumae TaxID=337 RepID=UPI002151EB44|nr:hypothetical protein [Burkholderia glumae]
MTDKELLELAAKAAGMNVLAEPWPEESGWFFCLHHGDPALHFRNLEDRDVRPNPWKPLNDDGDALRLAVSAPTIIDLQWIIAEAWQAHDGFDARIAYVRRAIVEKIALPFARTTDTGGEA